VGWLACVSVCNRVNLTVMLVSFLVVSIYAPYRGTQKVLQLFQPAFPAAPVSFGCLLVEIQHQRGG
jgi:hypothetical protein